MKTFLVIVAAIASPLLLHWAVVQESDRMLQMFFVLLALAVLAMGVRRRQFVPHLLVAGVLVGIAYLVDVRIIRALTPVWGAFVYVALAWVFGRTLRGAVTPLVERFARMEHTNGVPAELVPYARRLTLIWTVLFVLLAIGTIVLAVTTTTEVLSLFTNIVSWLLITILYFAEYAYRQWWAFPHVPHHNPMRVAMDIARNAPQLLR
jgi:uncharacterized membrane protein